MWSDNDIDNAFQRLNPPEPEPTPFPLDAWLRLETQLDKEEVARTVRRKMWRFFAAEVLVVALVGLGWLLWRPAGPAPTPTTAATVAAGRTAESSATPSPANSIAHAGRKATAVLDKASAVPAVSPVAKDAAPAAAPAAARTLTTASAMSTPKPSTPVVPDAAMATRRLLAAIVVPKHTLQSQPAENRQTSRRRLAFAPAVTSARHNRAKSTEATSAARFSSSSAPASPVALAERSARRNATFIEANDATGGAAGSNSAVQGDNVETSAPSLQSATAGTDGNVAAASAQADNAPLTPVTVDLARAAAGPLPTALTKGAELAPVTIARQPRFFIGLVGAPDVSTVRFASVERPLLNLGLTLEYRFGNRLRISTGLLRGNKEYYARRDDYDWTNYPRAQTRDFDWVEGKCTVLDVPLNLRYDAVVRDNGRWFGAAGLSSFFMQRENYSYDYREGGGYKLWEMPGLVNANHHLFSVLNLSGGYERSLGPHWRLQGEPYLKVPLGGVGAGKVKLTSAGVFLGVKYGF